MYNFKILKELFVITENVGFTIVEPFKLKRIFIIQRHTHIIHVRAIF